MGFSNDKRDQLVGVVGALFALPFILFSMAGGYFADRFSKRSVTIGIKVFEIFVMLLALCGLAANRLYLAIACVFLMEVHSALFGPSKYGLLPELLPEKNFPGATASSNSAPSFPSLAEPWRARPCAKYLPDARLGRAWC
jgi:MFS family permease